MAMPWITVPGSQTHTHGPCQWAVRMTRTEPADKPWIAGPTCPCRFRAAAPTFDLRFLNRRFADRHAALTYARATASERHEEATA